MSRRIDPDLARQAKSLKVRNPKLSNEKIGELVAGDGDAYHRSTIAAWIRWAERNPPASASKRRPIYPARPGNINPRIYMDSDGQQWEEWEEDEHQESSGFVTIASFTFTATP